MWNCSTVRIPSGERKSTTEPGFVAPRISTIRQFEKGGLGNVAEM
jgi:hypothetical protein